MAKLLRLRRGTDTQHTTFTGAEGEVTVNTTNDSLHVHDGTTAGGTELAKADLSNVDGSLSNNLGFGDNVKATFGASQDLEIYHDGTNSYVKDEGTGGLRLTTNGNNIAFQKGLTETLAVFRTDGGCELYYDNVNRLQTTSTGINVTGSVEADSANITGVTTTNRLVVDDDGSSSPNAVFKADDASPWAVCIKNDTYSTNEEVGFKVYQGNSGEVELYNTGNAAYATTKLAQSNGTTNRTGLFFGSSGDIQLYYQNAQKLATTSGGINVTGTVNCDGLTCEGDAYIQSGLGVLRLKDTNNTGSGAQNYIAAQDSAGTQQWYLGQTSNGGGTFEIMNQQAASIYFGTNNAWRTYLTNSGHWIPAANNQYDLGDSSNRWRNLYTNDLNLSNEGGSNDVDGTWGSWTIQEGEDDLFLLNRRNGKKYKFNLSEVN